MDASDRTSAALAFALVVLMVALAIRGPHDDKAWTTMVQLLGFSR